MALPKIKQPVYEYKGVEYRGFTHAEEKILLQIKEDVSDSVKYKNIKKIMEQCTFGKIDISKISSDMFEMLFIKIRAKSSGEIQKIKYKCKNKNSDDVECGNEFFITINLDDIDIEQGEKEPTDTIKLDNELSMKLKQASIDDLLEAGDDSENQMKAYIDYVYDDEEVYRFSDMEDDEVSVFIDSIPSIKKKEIKDFVSSQPKATLNVSEECSKCGKTHELKLTGLNNFFG